MSLHQTPATTDTTLWDHNRGVIFSEHGGWEVGKAIHNCGYSMMDDLVGHHSYFQVLVLNTTGKLPERRLAEWLEAICICLSWPDARIWCNQIGSLAGTMRTSPIAAISAGILSSDSRMYGPGTLLGASNAIAQALIQYRNGDAIEQIVERCDRRKPDGTPVIVGYIRPLATGDERIPAMQRVSTGLGFKTGDHLHLAYQLETYLQKNYREGMNLAGYCAAFLLDQGLSATEIYRLLSTWVHSGIHACYAEAYDRPAETFLPQHCADINYKGKNRRKVPPG